MLIIYLLDGEILNVADDEWRLDGVGGRMVWLVPSLYYNLCKYYFQVQKINWRK